MKLWTRWIALVTLAAFVGLASAESVHVHALAGAPEASCTLCQAAHQTPALSAPLAVQHTVLVVADSPILAVAAPASESTLLLTGRSPPVL